MRRNREQQEAWEQYQAQKIMKKRIQNIPKKNKEKFAHDLLKLIDLAYGDNYEDYYL